MIPKNKRSLRQSAIVTSAAIVDTTISEIDLSSNLRLVFMKSLQSLRSTRSLDFSGQLYENQALINTSINKPQ